MEPKPAAVSCTGCARTWNSASMAEGLRLLGACPRCGGGLSFAADSQTAAEPDRFASADATAVAPHLVLGIPRR